MSTQYNPSTVDFIKKQEAQRAKRRLLATAAGVVVVAGLAFAGWYGYGAYNQNKAVAQHDSALSTLNGLEGRERWQKAQEMIESGQLTREQMREAMEEQQRKEWQATMDGFFKTPAKERDAYLDKIIDEMEARRQEWMRNRPATQPTTRPNREERGERERRPEGDDAQRRSEMESRQRQRTDNQSPQARAQNAEFMAALRARMDARGVRGGPGGPGGGRGGPGGGWDGGGGGGGRGGR